MKNTLSVLLNKQALDPADPGILRRSWHTGTTAAKMPGQQMTGGSRLSQLMTALSLFGGDKVNVGDLTVSEPLGARSNYGDTAGNALRIAGLGGLPDIMERRRWAGRGGELAENTPAWNTLNGLMKKWHRMKYGQMEGGVPTGAAAGADWYKKQIVADIHNQGIDLMTGMNRSDAANVVDQMLTDAGPDAAQLPKPNQFMAGMKQMGAVKTQLYGGPTGVRDMLSGIAMSPILMPQYFNNPTRSAMGDITGLGPVGVQLATTALAAPVDLARWMYLGGDPELVKAKRAYKTIQGVMPAAKQMAAESPAAAAAYRTLKTAPGPEGAVKPGWLETKARKIIKQPWKPVATSDLSAALSTIDPAAAAEYEKSLVSKPGVMRTVGRKIATPLAALARHPAFIERPKEFYPKSVRALAYGGKLIDTGAALLDPRYRAAALLDYERMKGSAGGAYPAVLAGTAALQLLPKTAPYTGSGALTQGAAKLSEMLRGASGQPKATEELRTQIGQQLGDPDIAAGMTPHELVSGPYAGGLDAAVQRFNKTKEQPEKIGE
jgi:hypothetical protein